MLIMMDGGTEVKSGIQHSMVRMKLESSRNGHNFQLKETKEQSSTVTIVSGIL